jgi:hypothetical protein
MDIWGFQGLCKEFTKKEIFPADLEFRKTKQFDELLDIANIIITRNGFKYFFSFLQQGHYFIDLWVAHIIIEYTNAVKADKEIAKKVIESYAAHPRDTERIRKMALLEERWLASYI